MFTFDWTISFGNILTVVGILGTWAWMFMSMKAELRVQRHDMGNLKERLSQLNEAFTQLGKILTQVAVQDTRLSMMEKAIDEMRHGQGFIRKSKTND